MFIWMIKVEFMGKHNGNFSWLFRSWCAGVSQEQKWVYMLFLGPNCSVSTEQMLFLCVCLRLAVDLWRATKSCEKQQPYSEILLQWSHRGWGFYSEVTMWCCSFALSFHLLLTWCTVYATTGMKRPCPCPSWGGWCPGSGAHCWLRAVPLPLLQSSLLLRWAQHAQPTALTAVIAAPADPVGFAVMGSGQAGSRGSGVCCIALPDVFCILVFQWCEDAVSLLVLQTPFFQIGGLCAVFSPTERTVGTQ